MIIIDYVIDSAGNRAPSEPFPTDAVAVVMGDDNITVYMPGDDISNLVSN